MQGIWVGNADTITGYGTQREHVSSNHHIDSGFY